MLSTMIRMPNVRCLFVMADERERGAGCTERRRDTIGSAHTAHTRCRQQEVCATVAQAHWSDSHSGAGATSLMSQRSVLVVVLSVVLSVVCSSCRSLRPVAVCSLVARSSSDLRSILREGGLATNSQPHCNQVRATDNTTNKQRRAHCNTHTHTHRTATHCATRREPQWSSAPEARL